MFTFSLDGYREQASGSPPNGLRVTAPTRNLRNSVRPHVAGR